MITCRDLSFSYPGPPHRQIISAVNLTWRQGEYLTVYGGNGSGKSTLGLCLAGVLWPSGGAVELDGRPVGAGSPHGPSFPDVGLVFQNPEHGFFADTVERDVAFNLENLNRPPDRIAARVAESLAEVGISRLAGERLGDLSAGEKKLVALAGALASEPRFLILDEPTSLLDPDWSERIHALLRRLHRRGLGLMVLTCDPDEVGEEGPALLLADSRLRSIEEPSRLRAEADWRGNGPRGRASAEAADPDHTVLRLEEVGLDRPRPALDRIAFSVSRGEVLGIVGPNGCGKTTLLMVLAGIAAPDRGRVTFIEGPPPPGYIGLAFQDAEDGLFARTVEEELRLARDRAPRDRPAGRGRGSIEGALGSVGLAPEDYLQRLPWTLSPGEARRVALAALLAGGAELLLLDEPAGSLDPPGRRDLAACLRRLAGEGRAVVLTACRPDTAAVICDRILFLREGGGRLSVEG